MLTAFFEDASLSYEHLFIREYPDLILNNNTIDKAPYIFEELVMSITPIDATQT
jgi:hypothetical protein